MARQDQARVTLVVDGRDCGVYSKREGGAVDSEETKYPPGGMQPEVSLGGRRTVENVTLNALQTLPSRETIRFMRSRVGKGEAVCTEQPLDVDGNSFGPPDVWRGKLKKVGSADHDSTSDDPAEFEVEISTDGTVG